MAINLENLERQRIRIYKDYLKQQIERNAKIRKQQNNYQKRKQQANINQLISRLDEDDVRRLEERRNMALLLKQHNSGLSELKKSMHMEDSNLEMQGNPSFLDRINKDDIQRISKNKQTFANFTHDNQAHQHTKKDIQDRVRSLDRLEEEKHLNRLKQMQQLSHRNYEEIKKKHEQNMRLYEMHSNLMQENEQHRKLAQKFTDCEQDIISRLKRNESAERKRIYRYNQEILKHQMGEFNQRKSLERSQILEGQDIDQSIFKNLMHGSPNYKKQYGEQLRSQMSEMETRKSEEKHTLKQKYKINGIFGGEHGRERQAQIQYIDRKMGLARMNKSVSVNNEEDYNKESSKPIEEYSRRNSHYALPQEKQIKLGKNMKREAVLNLPISTEKPTIDAFRTVIKNPQEMESAKQVGNTGIKEEQGNFRSEKVQDKKLFRSYDVVTGKSKFYG